jgi:hypothetical protein
VRAVSARARERGRAHRRGNARPARRAVTGRRPEGSRGGRAAGGAHWEAQGRVGPAAEEGGDEAEPVDGGDDAVRAAAVR